MVECRKKAEACVALRGYRMDAQCLAEWTRRCTLENIRILYTRQFPPRTPRHLNLLGELMLINTIMEAQIRGSRLLTLSDLHAASAKLGLGEPFCAEN